MSNKLLNIFLFLISFLWNLCHTLYFYICTKWQTRDPNTRSSRHVVGIKKLSINISEVNLRNNNLALTSIYTSFMGLKSRCILDMYILALTMWFNEDPAA